MRVAANIRSPVPAFALLAAPACAPLPLPHVAPSEMPCRGSRFDADHPDARCLVPHSELLVPPKAALAIRTVPTPAVIHRGLASKFTLEFRNVSGAPLPLELDNSCLAFESVARNETASSFESECGGLCVRASNKLRVMLEPGGILQKSVDFVAVQRRIDGDQCSEKNLGPLPPGRYTLKVTLPWTDPAPIPGNAQARAWRTFAGALLVEP